MEGETARTDAALDDAIRTNPHVVDYLLDLDSIPFDRPPHFTLGSRDEAAYVAAELADACDATAGFESWLRSLPTPRRARSRTSKPNPTRRAYVVVGQLCGARVESYKA